jgi:hypothetical protein
MKLFEPAVDVYNCNDTYRTIEMHYSFFESLAVRVQTIRR